MRIFLLIPALMLIGCDRDETVAAHGGAGTWQLQSIDGAAFDPAATLTLGKDGAISGRAPCNGWSATQTAPYPWFALSPIAVTRMACPDMEAETAFFSALSTMTISEVSGDTLLLSNEAGGEMIFNSAEPDG